MRVEKAYARFFRSLNYDYLRKADRGYQPDPWDETPDGTSYPFVEVKLESDITTVVGANEAGKSQLLDAIKCALTGDGIERGDFCRYSPFFSRDSALTHPEFGLGLCDMSEDERDVIKPLCDLEEAPAKVVHAALFRMNATPKLRLYVHDGSDWTMYAVKKSSLLKELGLPRYFEIDSEIPLPDVVPLDYLESGRMSGADRADYRARFDRIRDKAMEWFANPDALRAAAPEVVAALGEASEPDEVTKKKFKLADDLLITVAGLDRSLFAELHSAISQGRGGYAGGIVDTINQELAAGLNFPHWWSQDSQFELRVDSLEHDLVFMIRDRTDRTYSFDERSEGLKYFLSYFVQYLSHQPPEDGQTELLLMDEPDAYLSASGQQDLLRIFDAFAHPGPEPPRRSIQAVYVTHSPFLIDKNHAERIRVLDKGEHDEGTRVVANASRNHYEPLRSALGSFVGETTFIGSCNLVLEGASDQIIIAGVSSWLARQGVAATQRLDLNTISLVPAGSASHVPYLAFLARGRDVERPPIIVLLDGDSAGDEARKTLERGGPHRKQLLAAEYIVQLSDDDLASLTTDHPKGPAGIEDLFPLDFAVTAVKRYCREFAPELKLDNFAPSAKAVYGAGDTHAGLEKALRDHIDDQRFDIDKVGFARSLVDGVSEPGEAKGPGVKNDLEVIQANFTTLLTKLARMQRQAEREVNSEKISSRVNRTKKRFLSDHSQSATREEVSVLIEEIEGQLDQSVESEDVRAEMRDWRREFKLDDDPRSQIDDFSLLRDRLGALAYAGQLKVQKRDTT
jgi:predicted ATPase